MAGDDVYREVFEAGKNGIPGRKYGEPRPHSSLTVSTAVAREIERRGLCVLLPAKGRAWLACCGAARGARILDVRTPFYVANSVAAQWQLTPDQLRRGLDALEEAGFVETVEARRGLHRRIRFGPEATPTQTHP